MKKILIITAMTVLLAASAAQASVINLTGGVGADGYTLEQAWLGAVGSVTTESFEGLSANSQDTGSGIALAIGTLSGYGHVGSSGTHMDAFNEHAVDGVNYWSNAAPNSSSAKGGFTLNLNSGVNTVGFYSIDFHDVGGQVEITVNTLTGSQTFNLFSEGTVSTNGVLGTGTGSLASGTEIFWVVEADSQITSIEFHQSGGDGYAIDGVTTAATPIPAAVWLLGSGLLGMVGFKRIRR